MSQAQFLLPEFVSASFPQLIAEAEVRGRPTDDQPDRLPTFTTPPDEYGDALPYHQEISPTTRTTTYWKTLPRRPLGREAAPLLASTSKHERTTKSPTFNQSSRRHPLADNASNKRADERSDWA